MRLLHALRLPWSSWTWLVLAWALLSCAVWLGTSGGATPAQLPLQALLDWQPALWQTQPWRLWTAAIVHWSGSHVLLNVLGCGALVAWGNAAALGARQTWAWLAAWPLTHVLLLASPALAHYGGLSGVLHAGVAIGAWTLLWQGHGQRRVVGALVLAGLGLKLVLEVPLLAQGAVARGAVIVENCAVRRLDIAAGRVAGVFT